VVFTRSGERWTHALVLPSLPGIAVAQTVECEADQKSSQRVASPVYQELQPHELAGGSSLCLLLTGRLLEHHFSAAVTLGRGRQDARGLILDFDVADRCRAAVEVLAATYLVRLDSGALEEAGPDAIIWTTDPARRQQLALHAEPPATLLLAEAGRQATRVQAVASLAPGSFTHRLRYQWRWTSAADLTR
jgi:hypothetical protein